MTDSVTLDHSYITSTSANSVNFPDISLANTHFEETCQGSSDLDFCDDGVYTGVDWREGRVIVDLYAFFQCIEMQEMLPAVDTS